MILDEPIPVLVLACGEWRPGTLQKWRQVAGRWHGYVAYENSGAVHVAWRDQELLRPDAASTGADAGPVS